LPITVRSWNVFHGNSVPPSRHGHLEEMVGLATRDRPAVLCLQEVPVWALCHLERWSGMHAFGMVARDAVRPGFVSARITRLHQGLFRSSLAGQANAILVGRSFMAESLGGVQVSEPGRERRVVQAVRVEGVGIVGNLHATNAVSTPAVPAAELERAGEFLDGQSEGAEPRILAGDMNHHEAKLPGYENGGPGIDHILVAGAPAAPLVVWERDRRLHNGRVLSDHAPVERVIG
jgi:endonuclease/exonuclease/phosphatase family metal-dependent hydrolase